MTTIWVEPYLQAFSVLNAGRHYQISMEGANVFPITLTEIYAYFQIVGLENKVERYEYLLVIQALDEMYLKHARETLNK